MSGGMKDGLNRGQDLDLITDYKDVVKRLKSLGVCYQSY